jgi:hypothetical protein
MLDCIFQYIIYSNQHNGIESTKLRLAPFPNHSCKTGTPVNPTERTSSILMKNVEANKNVCFAVLSKAAPSMRKPETI